MVIIGVIIWVIGVINLLTKSHDPPSMQRGPPPVADAVDKVTNDAIQHLAGSLGHRVHLLAISRE